MYNFSTVLTKDGKKKLKFLSREKQNYFLIGHLDYIIMCGTLNAALVLASIEHAIIERVHAQSEARGHNIESDYWIRMSYSYIVQRTFEAVSRPAIKSALDILVQKGYLRREKGTDTETYRYFIDFHLVEKHHNLLVNILGMQQIDDHDKIDFKATKRQFEAACLYENKQVGNFYLYENKQALVRMFTSTCNDPYIRSSREVAVEKAYTSEPDEPRPDPIQALTESGTVIDKQTSSYENTYTPTANAFGVTLKEDFLIDRTTQKESIITANELDNTNKTKEKTEKMTETEIVLKRYEQSPKQFKNQWFRNKKLVKLNQDFGDKMDAVIEEYGYDAALGAMEAFLADEYWKENGQPLPAFFKQIDRWMGEDQSALAAPRANSQPARNDGTPPIALRGCNEQEYYNGITPEQKKKAEMSQRRDEALRIMKMTEHPDYDEAYAICCRGFDHLTAPMIESWMTKGIERYNETHEWPLTIVSRPLL